MEEVKVLFVDGQLEQLSSEVAQKKYARRGSKFVCSFDKSGNGYIVAIFDENLYAHIEIANKMLGKDWQLQGGGAIPFFVLIGNPKFPNRSIKWGSQTIHSAGLKDQPDDVNVANELLIKIEEFCMGSTKKT